MITKLTPMPQEVIDYFEKKSCDMFHTKTPFATGKFKRDEDGFNQPVIEWRCKECECKAVLHEGKT